MQRQKRPDPSETPTRPAAPGTASAPQPPHTGWRWALGLALARLTWRRLFVRLIGVVACLIALTGIGATIYIYRQIGRTEAATQAQLGQLSNTFTEISATLRVVSDSALHAGTTVDDAKSSLRSASDATRSAANSLDQTAGAINVSILGQRPLAGVDTTFREQAVQLRMVARELDQTGGALTQNAGDLRTISGDLSVLAQEMDGVSRQLRQIAGYGPGPGSLVGIAQAARLLLSWSIVLHLVIFAMGLALNVLTFGRHPGP